MARLCWPVRTPSTRSCNRVRATERVCFSMRLIMRKARVTTAETMTRAGPTTGLGGGTSAGLPGLLMRAWEPHSQCGPRRRREPTTSSTASSPPFKGRRCIHENRSKVQGKCLAVRDGGKMRRCFVIVTCFLAIATNSCQRSQTQSKSSGQQSSQAANPAPTPDPPPPPPNPPSDGGNGGSAVDTAMAIPAPH